MRSNQKLYKIFIIAGEASGDVLGGKLVDSLKSLNSNLKIVSIGGDNLLRSGAEILFNCTDIAVMGFTEILPKLPKILQRLNQTVNAIEQFCPDMVITIDSPGFNFRVVSSLQKRRHLFHTKFVHYVAPTVWAYKKERALKVAKLYDHILLLLPFERPYFEKVGLAATYVGHPLIEDFNIEIKPLNIGKNALPILVMPGSRLQEIQNMGSIFKDALELLQTKYNLRIIALIPTTPELKEKIEEIFQGIPGIISADKDDKQKFFKTAEIAIVKSGTSSLEMAIHNIPCVVGYKMSKLTYWYIKRLIYIPYISLVNILLNKPILNELIQDNCTSANIAQSLVDIMQTKQKDQIKTAYKKVSKMLNNKQNIKPSLMAAQTILKLLK